MQWKYVKTNIDLNYMSAFSVETVDYDYDIIENNLEFIPEKKVRHIISIC